MPDDPVDVDVVVVGGRVAGALTAARLARHGLQPFGVQPDRRRLPPEWSDDDRPRIRRVAGEREALTAYLDYYRATVEMKCRGLTTEQARTRSMPPSTMSLHGLVRHLAGVERWWFRRTSNGVTCRSCSSPKTTPISTSTPADADFGSDQDAWRAECAISRDMVAAHDLDDTARPLDWYEDVDLRWLILRMITEYAQHCGHVDLLREGIDRKTGA